MPRDRSDRAARRRYARCLAFGAALLLCAPARVLAQGTCVQAEVKGEKPSPYACLNQEMQQEAEGAHAPPPSPPLGATSPPNQVGTFDEQSVSEQYGKNFGKSAIPYRPPPPVFANPLGPAR